MVDRKERILAAAARLFARHGVAGTTVRMIGDEAGMLSGSLYHHFPSKEAMADDLLSTYFDDLFRRYDAVLEASNAPVDRLTGLIRASFRSIADHPEACEIYRNDYKHLSALPGFEGLVESTRRVQRTWMVEIDAGVRAGLLRSDLDPILFYRFARDAVWQSARWFRPEGTHTVDEVADTCLLILLQGFGEPAT